MGSGDYLVAGDQDPTLSCPGQDVCCTTPNLRYSMRVDCVASDAPIPANAYWPAVTTSTGGGGPVTGCRYVFDGDRDGKRAPGNIIKPDFSFDHVPAQGFTQHVINTVDFPFADMDNRIVDGSPAHIQHDAINWYKGQTIVQNVFSMFACDAGAANEPPFFVKGLCQDFGNINACEDSTNIEPIADYECAFWEVCDIDLYARDFVLSGSTGISTRPATPVANANPPPATTENKVRAYPPRA